MMVRSSWPVKLFWLPFDSPHVFSLGLVSSSFLLEKRRRRPRTGCYVAVDNEPQGPSPDRKEKKRNQPNSGVSPDPARGSDTVTECKFRGSLRRKAKSVLRFFETDRGLKRAHALPSRIECGYFRSAIRRCFSEDLTLADELSLKTACKIERRYCEPCSQQFDEKIDKWKKDRFVDLQVDDDHLSRFTAAIRRNVEEQWNLGMVWPYVPNGHATAYHDRAEGGNWNEEELSDIPSVGLAVSSGKPRIVTAYSSRLTEVLYPLHRSLYATLKRKGWLLVGEPTPEKVASLNGCGEYVSVDYSSATDNIKTAYTRAAVEVLIQTASGLSEEQEWALRTVGSLRLDGKPATRGQPMGSMMSFPLLCLINKTCVDLSLNDLLEDGEISFKEWTSHRCLINGDDLLLKSPTHQGALTYLPRLIWHGGQVGLVVNKEKTMVSSTGCAEINSTLFIDGVLEKKTNAGIFRGGDVSDVLGYCDRSTVSTAGFLAGVRALVPKLRLQVVKAPTRPLSITRWRALLREARINPSLKDALTTVVQEEPLGNAFPVDECPDGYDLCAEEEKACIDARVAQLRQEGYKGEGACGLHSSKFFTREGLRMNLQYRKSVQGNTSLRKALSRKIPATKKTILKVLVDSWQNKTKERLVVEDDASVDALGIEHVCDICAAQAPIFRISCELKAFNKRNRTMRVDAVYPAAECMNTWDF